MKILVVVDMQNDFITGSLGTPEAQAIVNNVVRKIEEHEGPIIVTYDTHNENYHETMEGKKLPVVHCVDGTDGWELNPAVFDVLDNKYLSGTSIEVFYKPTFGCMNMVEWIAETFDIKDIDEIELVGLCTDICVVSNALLLKAAFYDVCEISVDAACCAGVTPESHEAALKTMEMCQINVKRG